MWKRKNTQGGVCKLTKREKVLLLAMCIGDGHIRNNRPTHLCVRHCEKQKPFIEFKAGIISKAIGRDVNISPFDNSGYPAYRFEKSIPYVRIIHKWLYKNGKKYYSRKVLDKLTPEAIAIWFMDDGSLTAKKREGKIHAYDLSLATYCSEEEANTIIKYFTEKWDIKFTKKRNKGRFSVRCGTKMARKFSKIVEAFIIPSMYYKIDIPEKVKYSLFPHK